MPGSSKLNLISQRHIIIFLLSAVIINILNWIIAYYIVANSNSNLIVLHYNVDFGADLIGQVKRIYAMPILGFVIILTNAILSFTIYKKEQFITNSLLISGLISNIFLLTALGALYLVNFR